MVRSLVSMMVAVLLGTVAWGCGPAGPEMTRVSGKVTYKGQPVSKGMITLVPVSPEGRNATGLLGPDGSYTLQTQEPGDGAILGEYKVTISAKDEDVPLDYIPKKAVAPKRLAPAKYEDPEKSGLTASVKRGMGPLNFDLVD